MKKAAPLGHVARMGALHQRVYAHDGARYPGPPVPHIAISREERDLAHPPKPARGAKPPFGRRRLRAFRSSCLTWPRAQLSGSDMSRSRAR